MKPKNFPARKLLRQFVAQKRGSAHELEMARTIRTKKVRGSSTTKK